MCPAYIILHFDVKVKEIAKYFICKLNCCIQQSLGFRPFFTNCTFPYTLSLKKVSILGRASSYRVL